MGIYDFYSSFVSKVAKDVINQSVADKQIEGLSIDMNGLIHMTAQDVFLYGRAGIQGRGVKVGDFAESYANGYMIPPKEMVKKFNLAFIDNLTRLIKTFNPRQYLLMCVDGVAPGAKIAQQRSRRYKDAPINPEEKYLVFNRIVAVADKFARDSKTPDEGMKRVIFSEKLRELIVENEEELAGNIPPLGRFLGPMITPGTELMSTLNKRLNEWIAEQKSINNLFPPITVYSGPDVVGEGEHKITSSIRELTNARNIKQGNGVHIIHGKDSDLTMLAFLLPLKKMFICTADEIDRSRYSGNVDIDGLFAIVRNFMTADGTAKSASFDDGTIARDFVVISMLIGNDFLPKILAVEGIQNGHLIETYHALEAPLTARLSTVEAPTGGRSRGVGVDPEVTGAPVAGYNIILSNLANYFYILATNERMMLTDLAVKQKADFNPRDFSTYFGKSEALEAAFDEKSGYVDLEKFRENWYVRIGDIKNYSNAANGLKAFGSVNQIVNATTCKYVGMMEWVLRYYTVGDTAVSWSNTYPFIAAPTLSDIAMFLINYIKAEVGPMGGSIVPPDDNVSVVAEVTVPRSPRPERGGAGGAVDSAPSETRTSAPTPIYSETGKICDEINEKASQPLTGKGWEASLGVPTPDAVNGANFNLYVNELQAHLYKVLLPIFNHPKTRNIAVSKVPLSIWIRSLTSPTRGDGSQNYETFEKLGDKVMAYEFGSLLFANHPNATPAELSNLIGYYMSKEYQPNLTDALKLKDWALIGPESRDFLNTDKSRTDLIESFCEALVLVSKYVRAYLTKEREYELVACSVPSGSESVGVLLRVLFSTRNIDYDKYAQNASKTILADINTLFGLRGSGFNTRRDDENKTRDAEGNLIYNVIARRPMVEKLRAYGITIPEVLASSRIEKDAYDTALRFLEEKGLTREWMSDIKDKSSREFLRKEQNEQLTASLNKLTGSNKVIFEVPSAQAAARKPGDDYLVSLTAKNQKDDTVISIVRMAPSIQAAKFALVNEVIEASRYGRPPQ